MSTTGAETEPLDTDCHQATKDKTDERLLPVASTSSSPKTSIHSDAVMDRPSVKRRLSTDVVEDEQSEAVTFAKKGKGSGGLVQSRRSHIDEVYTRQETNNLDRNQCAIYDHNHLTTMCATVETNISSKSQRQPSHAVDNTVGTENLIDVGDNGSTDNSTISANLHMSRHLSGTNTDSSRANDIMGKPDGANIHTQDESDTTTRGLNDYTPAADIVDSHTAVDGDNIEDSMHADDPITSTSNLVNSHTPESGANSYSIGRVGDHAFVGNSFVVDSRRQDNTDIATSSRATDNSTVIETSYIVNSHTQGDRVNTNRSRSVCIIGETYERWRASISAMNTTDAIFARHLLDMHDRHCENCRQRATRVLPEV